MKKVLGMIFVPGKFPTLNELIGLAKRHWGAYAGVKKKHTKTFAQAFADFKPASKKITVQLTWYEPTRRRDPDNVMSAVKFVMDGLVEAGVIENDNFLWVDRIIHQFFICDRQGVEVIVEE